MKKKSGLGPNFVIGNAVITMRFRSNIFVTPLFNRKISKYVLSCEFPLSKFDPTFFKEFPAALVYMDIKDRMYVARVGSYSAVVTPEVVSLDIVLANIMSKDVFDLEHLTPRTFYNDIMSNKRFFQRAGKSLDQMVSPLGISRKFSESDQAFRRRVIQYLQFQMGGTIDVDAELKDMLSKRKEEDLDNEP